MYNISVSLDEKEFIEIAAMVWGVNNWYRDDSSIATAFKKIRDNCEEQVNEDQRTFLNDVTAAVRKAFGEPSLERGMIQGGLECIMKQVDDDLNGQ